MRDSLRATIIPKKSGRPSSPGTRSARAASARGPSPESQPAITLSLFPEEGTTPLTTCNPCATPATPAKETGSRSMLRIWSLRKGAPAPPPDAVRVDRGTPWGNPSVLRREGERDAACDACERYAVDRLAREPGWLAPLRGKDVVCWCAPKRCHADTLLRLANGEGDGAGTRVPAL